MCRLDLARALAPWTVLAPSQPDQPSQPTTQPNDMTPTPAPITLAAQRARALADANSVRTRRAELKQDLHDDPEGAGSHLGRLLVDPPGYLRTARIGETLSWLPGVKGKRAEAILEAAGVTDGLVRTVAALTERQSRALADLIRTPQTIPAVKRMSPRRALVAAPVLDDIAI
jgi:hypothetical protein